MHTARPIGFKEVMGLKAVGELRLFLCSMMVGLKYFLLMLLATFHLSQKFQYTVFLSNSKMFRQKKKKLLSVSATVDREEIEDECKLGNLARLSSHAAVSYLFPAPRKSKNLLEIFSFITNYCS